MSHNLRGAILALIAMGIFATHDVVVKTLGATYSAIQIVFFAALLSFPIVSVILMNDGKEANLRPRHPWWVSLRMVMTVITGVSAFYAFSVLPLAQVYVILFSSPLLVTILSIPLLGERVRCAPLGRGHRRPDRRDHRDATGAGGAFRRPSRGHGRRNLRRNRVRHRA